MTCFRFRHVLPALVLLGATSVLAQPAPSASGQSQAESQQFKARVDEAARALGSEPRLKKVSEQKRQQMSEFVIGNMLFTLLHESAHGLVNQMELPVLGREEDAADAFATVTILKVGTAVSHGVLVEAAKAWFLTTKRARAQGEKEDFYDAHGLDEQRAYQIVCLMVGSDKKQFKDLADQTNLPEDRQDSCGEINAQWQPPNRKVVLCYELAQDFAQLYRDYGQDWEAPPQSKWRLLRWWKR